MIKVELVDKMRILVLAALSAAVTADVSHVYGSPFLTYGSQRTSYDVPASSVTGSEKFFQTSPSPYFNVPISEAGDFRRFAYASPVVEVNGRVDSPVVSTPAPLGGNFLGGVNFNSLASSTPADAGAVSTTPAGVGFDGVSSTPSPLDAGSVSSTPAPVSFQSRFLSNPSFGENFVRSEPAGVNFDTVVSSTPSPLDASVSSTPASVNFDSRLLQANPAGIGFDASFFGSNPAGIVASSTPSPFDAGSVSSTPVSLGFDSRFSSSTPSPINFDFVNSQTPSPLRFFNTLPSQNANLVSVDSGLFRQDAEVNSVTTSAGSLDESFGSQEEPEPEVVQHVYFYAASEEPEAIRPRVNIVSAPKKNVRVIFIKAPSPPQVAPVEIVAPAQEQEKTVVYVLSKKPEEQQTIHVKAAPAPPPPKPEIHFIKYKTQQEAEEAIRKVQAGERVPHQQVQSVSNERLVDSVRNQVYLKTQPLVRYVRPNVYNPAPTPTPYPFLDARYALQSSTVSPSGFSFDSPNINLGNSRFDLGGGNLLQSSTLSPAGLSFDSSNINLLGRGNFLQSSTVSPAGLSFDSSNINLLGRGNFLQSSTVSPAGFSFDASDINLLGGGNVQSSTASPAGLSYDSHNVNLLENLGGRNFLGNSLESSTPIPNVVGSSTVSPFSPIYGQPYFRKRSTTAR